MVTVTEGDAVIFAWAHPLSRFLFSCLPALKASFRLVMVLPLHGLVRGCPPPWLNPHAFVFEIANVIRSYNTFFYYYTPHDLSSLSWSSTLLSDGRLDNRLVPRVVTTIIQGRRNIDSKLPIPKCPAVREPVFHDCVRTASFPSDTGTTVLNLVFKSFEPI